MKLTWHIILKDIVRERWGLLTWALFFVGQDGIGIFARNFTGIDAEWVTGLQMASVALVFLQVTMGYILVARLVHADPLVGTSVFWRARPISAGRLLAAKLLGALGLFALLPVLLLLPWWLACNFGGREIFWAAVEVFGWQLLVIAPAFLVGSLTDDLGRVLLWTLLLLIGLVSWIVLLQSALVRMPSDMLGRPGVSLVYTRLWVCSVILIVGSLAIAAHQYLSRRFVRSVVLVVLGLGVIALTGQLWRRNWSLGFASLHKPALAPVDPKLAEALSFVVEPAVGNFGGGFKGRGDPGKSDASLQMRLSVDGLPDDMGIGVEDYLSHTWSWENSMQLTRWSGYFSWTDQPGRAVLRRAYALPEPVSDPETLRWRKLRWDRARAERGQPPAPFPSWWTSDRAEPPPKAETMLRGSVTLPNSFLAKMKSEPPAYRTDGHWLLYRPAITAELPLKDGVRAVAPGRTFYLQRMNGDKPLMIATRPAMASYGVWYSAAFAGEFRSWFLRERFMTVNRVNGDIVWVHDGQTGSQTLFVAGVIVNWNVLSVGPRLIIRDDQDLPADPQWRDHTFLALLEDRDVARLDRVVETRKFQLKPDAADKAAP